MISGKIESENHTVSALNHPKFHSPGDLFRELIRTLKLFWKMRGKLKKMDQRLRETISLTVTFANSCSV
jgi:hypothetical protein